MVFLFYFFLQSLCISYQFLEFPAYNMFILHFSWLRKTEKRKTITAHQENDAHSHRYRNSYCT